MLLTARSRSLSEFQPQVSSFKIERELFNCIAKPFAFEIQWVCGRIVGSQNLNHLGARGEYCWTGNYEIDLKLFVEERKIAGGIFLF